MTDARCFRFFSVIRVPKTCHMVLNGANSANIYKYSTDIQICIHIIASRKDTTYFYSASTISRPTAMVRILERGS